MIPSKGININNKINIPIETKSPGSSSSELTVIQRPFLLT